jgi:hypothetical protein
MECQVVITLGGRSRFSSSFNLTADTLPADVLSFVPMLPHYIFSSDALLLGNHLILRLVSRGQEPLPLSPLIRSNQLPVWLSRDLGAGPGESPVHAGCAVAFAEPASPPFAARGPGRAGPPRPAPGSLGERRGGRGGPRGRAALALRGACFSTWCCPQLPPPPPGREPVGPGGERPGPSGRKAVISTA